MALGIEILHYMAGAWLQEVEWCQREAWRQQGAPPVSQWRRRHQFRRVGSSCVRPAPRTDDLVGSGSFWARRALASGPESPVPGASERLKEPAHSFPPQFLLPSPASGPATAFPVHLQVHKAAASSCRWAHFEILRRVQPTLHSPVCRASRALGGARLQPCRSS